MKKLLLIAAVVSGLLIAASPFNYFQERYLLRLEKNARDSAYTLAQAYTTMALSSYSGSSPFFTTGVQFTDTLFCYSSDSTDTALIFWKSDTLWLSINGGVVSIPDLVGFTPELWIDSIQYLLLQTDSLWDSLNVLAGLVGGSGVSQDTFDVLRARVDTLEAELDTVDCYNEIKYVWIYASQDTINKYCPGWRLCDGTGGTPNLLNRFVIGAGDRYLASDSGGDTLNWHTVNTHGHDIDSSTSHVHGLSGFTKDSTVRYPGTGTKIYVPRMTTGSTIPNTDYGGNHDHSGKTGTDAPATDTVLTIPPYYGLTPIMRIKWIPS